VSKIPAVVILVISLFSVGGTRIISRERIELGYAPTEATASQEYAVILRGLNSPKVGDEKPDCRSDWLKAAESQGTEPRSCRFSPPFPLWSDAPTYPGMEPRLGWAPLLKVPKGLSRLKGWKAASETGVPYDCESAVCQVIVHALNPVPGEVTLASCKIVGEGNRVSGAPWDCHPIAIITSDGAWVRVVSEYGEVGKRTLGLPDFDFVWFASTLPEISTFLRDAQSALSSNPLQLATRIQIITSQAGVLLGTSEYVASKVLSDYKPRLREMATVRVEAFTGREDRISYIKLIVSTNLLVNTLASTSPEDWHRANQSQEEDYVKAVRANVKAYLDKACTQPMWWTERVLTCGLPREEIPTWALPR